jgi:putative peptide zinc metalloprotease protein
VAIAIVWVTDGTPVDQINEAWALSSCTNCQTVSVAFQGLFVVGQSDVITPQNIAVAVNYDCMDCHTAAIAVQLVATLTSLPSEAAMAKLSEMVAELEALEQSIDEMSLEDLLVELERIETEIVDILVDDGVLVVAAGTTAEVSTEATEAPAEETTTESSEATATETPAAEEPATGTEGGTEPSPAPTAEPQPSPTSQPSPTPTSEPSPTPTSAP